jgi:hypothetical protein
MTDDDRDFREVMRERKAQVEKKNNRAGMWIAVGIIALVGGCGALLSQAGSDEPSADDLRFDARRVCHDFIDKRLKSPASSDFEETSDMDVTSVGDTYTVRGKVDAQNGFGAMIRSDYTCTVRSIGDRWVLQEITGLN